MILEITRRSSTPNEQGIFERRPCATAIWARNHCASRACVANTANRSRVGLPDARVLGSWGPSPRRAWIYSKGCCRPEVRGKRYVPLGMTLGEPRRQPADADAGESCVLRQHPRAQEQEVDRGAEREDAHRED